MPASSNQTQWRIIAAAGGFSAVLRVLTTLLAVGYVRQRVFREMAR